MCIEDIRLGRKSFGAGKLVAIGSATTIVVQQTQKRVTLILNSLATEAVTYSPNTPVVIGQGIKIPAGTAPVKLNIKDDGSIVSSRWFGVAETGSESALIIEGILADE